MKRVFIQSYCKYPHGGALANYVKNLASAISYAGFSIILVSDLNEEYEVTDQKYFHMFYRVYGIKASDEKELQKRQKQCGFSEERLAVMKQEQITKDDVVIVLGIYNEYMLKELLKYRDFIGFKLVCGVLELFTINDYKNPETFYRINYIKENVYIKADAILSISDFINRHYNQKGMCTFKFPPMIDSTLGRQIKGNMDKRKIIISGGKDSFQNMLKAFCELTEQELSCLEVHISNMKELDVRENLGEPEWTKIKEYMSIHKWMSYEELEELYQQAHFLLIARDECQRTLANFPSKVPETMAYGIVPVVSEVGDYTKYYLEDGKNSIFINGDSVEEIVKSIRKAINLSEEEYNFYSEAAIECARNRFDYRNWLDEVRNMIEGV